MILHDQENYIIFFVFLSLIIFNNNVNAGVTDLEDPMHVHTENGSSTINATPAGLVFNNDGTKMFIANGVDNSNGNDVCQFNLSTPYDISTFTEVDEDTEANNGFEINEICWEIHKYFFGNNASYRIGWIGSDGSDGNKVKFCSIVN